MKYLSVCSGIEAATVAWHPLGWEAVAYSEIEKFPSQVLLHHYPNTPNWGDMTQFKGWPDATINVLVGGTPCQSFSVAGLRKGLDDPRGNLMLTYLAIARRYRPEWLVWENVPGVLSSANGRDFGSFLGGLAECGYGFAYRVLDAQYFGVAQRRKRVFVVGHFGNWQPAAAVLFERDGLQGNPAPSREARENTAPGVAGSLGCRGTRNTELDGHDAYIPQIVGTLSDGAHMGGGLTGKTHTQDASSQLPEVAWCLQERDAKGSDSDTKPGHLIPVIGGGFDDPVPMAQPVAWSEELTASVDVAGTIQYGGQGGRHFSVTHAMQVRRLTPVECERLQGFPDGYTDIKPKGKPTPDGPRYKALGNSMAVPCMAWIGERIQMVDKLCSELNNSKGKHETA